ncbi:MAG: rod shape-determining protein RodA [Bacteroidaceae bacterium]|nr:rod shape-determining protein RodA [Bacteroidaceae bacterium]
MVQENDNKGIFLSIDWITILLYVILITWGWFSVCGACYDFNNPDLFGFESNSGKQMVWAFTSLGLAAMLMMVEKKFYDTGAYVIYGTMLLALLVTIVIAPDTKGSRSWIPIGPVKIQPAEFAKFAVALALGKYMDSFEFNIHRTKDFIVTVAMILVPIVIIILQKETGTALVYLTFFLVLYREGMTGSLLFSAFAAVVYFVVGMKYSGDIVSDHLPVIIGEFAVLLLAQIFTTVMTWVYTKNVFALKVMGLGGIGITTVSILFSIYVIPFDICNLLLAVCIGQIVLLIGLWIHERLYKYILIAGFALCSTVSFYICHTAFEHLADHQRIRIEVLLGMKEDLRGAGYNVNQAKIAIGSGGMYGKGFLNGTQTKLKYVPEQHTDFIFCTVGEEEGFVGCTGVLLFYLLFIWRLIAVAERQPDTMGRVYGYSVVSIFLFHLFINVGMVLGLTPVIGIPLPFFSYGGSSLWGFTILLFIFLRMDAERNLKRQ